MFSSISKTAGAAAVALLLSGANPAHAEHFVRNYITLGGGVIDDVDVNGATASSQNFGSNLQSHVDLSAGTVKTYLQLTGPDSGGSGTGQAAGIFGDRLTFDGADGTDLTFSFDFDGQIVSPAWDPAYNSTLQLGVFANLYVFEAGTGATWENFSSHSGALVSKSLFLNYVNPADGLDDTIFRSLAGTVSVAGNQSFDVFASLSTFGALNNNPVTVELDFLNTATFGIKGAKGVSYTSDSGVFLGGAITSAVPEPATWAMMITGFGLAGTALRRSRRTAALAA